MSCCRGATTSCRSCVRLREVVEGSGGGQASLSQRDISFSRFQSARRFRQDFDRMSLLEWGGTPERLFPADIDLNINRNVSVTWGEVGISGRPDIPMLGCPYQPWAQPLFNKGPGFDLTRRGFA